MSGVSKLILGDKARDGQVIDTTAQPFQQLRGQFANQLQQMMQSPAQYAGRFAALMGQGEQQALQNVNQAAGQVGAGNATGQNALTTQASGAMNPFAGLNGLEQFGLNQVAGQAFGQNPLQGQANQFLQQQLSGLMNPYAGAAQLGGGEQQGLQAIQQGAFGANPLQNTVNQSLQQIAGGNNPMTAQLIQAAQQPILDNFSDQALQQRGLYTGAGQQVQGTGSSPFAQASARLAGGTQQALNNASLGVTQQAFGQQLQGLGMAQQQPGMQLQNQIAATQALGLPREVQQLGMNNQAGAFGQMQQNQFNAAGLNDQFSGNALQRALAGLTAAGTGQERQGAAFENASNRQLEAGSQLNQQQLQQQQAQLQAQMQNLQAQGLPRMIEQLGIEGGLGQFNQQQAQLQQLMQLLGGVTNAGSQTTNGTQASTGLLGSFLSGFSDRRLKHDIQYAGTTPNGTRLYRFRYINEDMTQERHMGVMADEVEHIPGAVTHNPIGLAMVDYGKVMAHG